MLRQRVTIVEAIKVALVQDNGDPEPEVYYYLPSGYKGRAIEVFESAYEELEVKLVSDQKVQLDIPIDLPKVPIPPGPPNISQKEGMSFWEIFKRRKK